jgi:hypothetical protein
MSDLRVTFDRIGRDHDAQPITVPDGDADGIAYHVLTYVRPRLASNGVEVAVHRDEMRGTIYCGFRVGGSFTLEPVNV